MKSLKSILKNAVVYPVIIGSLFLGAYRCGSDDSQPNPGEDAQVELDAGYDAGTLEDVLNSDIGKEDVPNGDNNGDNSKLDGGDDTRTDTGYDACVGCDTNPTDTFDIGYDTGGDQDLTDILDGGQDVVGPGDTGGDNEQPDGGQVKAVLKYLVNQNSSNPADYQDQPKTVNINLGDSIAYSACDSIGNNIGGYKITDNVGTVRTSVAPNCIMGSIEYDKFKGQEITTQLQLVDKNYNNIGESDNLIVNVK